MPPEEENKGEKPSSIESDKVLIVEGKDEENFFKALFKKLEINDVQIVVFEGKNNYSNQLQTLIIRSGFFNVRILGLTKDADDSFEKTEKSIKNLLKKCNLPIPNNKEEFKGNDILKIGYYIMPGNEESGMLESLCLKTVSDNPIMECVNNYYECIKTKNDKKFNEYKVKAQVFLAGMKPLVKSVGVGALKDFWNFDHESVNELKTFLSNFK